MKKSGKKRIFTFFMAAVMAVTVLIAAPVDVQASQYEENVYGVEMSVNDTAEMTEMPEFAEVVPVSGQPFTLSAPTGLWISGSTLHWNHESNATAFRVYINNTPASGNVHGFSFNLANANWAWGSTEIRVRALGNGFTTFDSVLSSPVSHGTTTTTLSAPTGLWISGNTLHWNPVSGALGYRVYIGGAAVSGTISNTTTSFNLANAGWSWSNHNVQVRALGDDVAIFSSALSSAVNWSTWTGTLSAPTGLWISGHTLHWNHVSNATAFRVYIDNAPVSGSVQGTSFDLGSIGHNWGWNWHGHHIRVRALGNGTTTFDSSLSNSVSYGGWGGALSAPTGLWVSGNTLHWNSVSGAQAYRVYVGGSPVSGRVYSTSFNLANISWEWHWDWNWGWHGHDIRVRALGNGTTTFDSVLSGPVSHGAWTGWTGTLSAPSQIWVSGNTLHWNSVSGAQAYRVYVGGVAVTGRIYSTSFNLNNIGWDWHNWNWSWDWNHWGWHGHHIQVRALGNGTTTFNSGLSSSTTWANWSTWVPPAPRDGVVTTRPPEPIPVTASAPAEVRLEGSVLHWNPVSNATGYVVYVDGTVRSSSTVATHFSLSALGLPAGIHNVQVRALGGRSVLDSELSQGVAFTATASGATATAQTAAMQVVTMPVQATAQEAPSGWASNSVNMAIAAGLVPQNLQAQYTQAITRAEFAALAVALYETITGEQILFGLPFYDTDDLNVMRLGAIGVVEGTGQGYFRPNDIITREQAAVMLTRLADAIGQPLPSAGAAFSDNAAIAPWALEAVGQLQAAGIMGDMGDNTFSPRGSYTREQSIVTMLRLFDNLR